MVDVMSGGNGGGSAVDSGWALLTYGCGFQTWDSGVRLVTRSGDLDCNRPFAASGYDGIQFRARASLPLMLQVATTETTLVAEGGLCQVYGDPGSGGPVGPGGKPVGPGGGPVSATKALALWPDDGIHGPGYDSCLFPFESALLYAPDWKLFRIPFVALRQKSQLSQFDSSAIMSLSWKVGFGDGRGPAGPVMNFTFAIDDVALYRE